MIQELTAFHVGRLLLHKPKINCVSVGWSERLQSDIGQEYWFEDKHFRVVGACCHSFAAVAENRNAKASPIVKGEPVSVGSPHRINITHHLFSSRRASLVVTLFGPFFVAHLMRA